MELKTPQSVNIEHEELHNELVKATECGGRTQEAAKVVADLLHQHFGAEEEYALPPLGLLPQIAEGIVPAEAEQVIEMTTRLKANLAHMLAEHRAIKVALNVLVKEATAEDKPEYAEFGRKLILHAQNEEEILYPAALLIGEYLKLRMEAGEVLSYEREVATTL